MPNTAIVADSGCDLPAELTARYQIDLAPLIARFGMHELIDTPASRAEFWQRYDISQPPQSSGPSVGTWAEVYEQALQRAGEVVAITLTGKHSGTFSSASVAAADFMGRVHVFDSWSLSVGEALLVLQAARMAVADHSAADILAVLESWRQRLRVYILLDTIEAVQRGGRLGPLVSIIKRMSSMLSIKPLLTLTEGTLEFDGAVRSIRKGTERVVSIVQDQRVIAAAIAHTRSPDIAGRLADATALATGLPRPDILVVEAGPALAVHAGPGAIGLAYVMAP